VPDSYVINLSFWADSHDQAEAVHSQVKETVRTLSASGHMSLRKIDFARDWLAVPDRTAPLRAAANKQITTGPPESELD
jgi:hypothetical protein